jgi:Fe2+ or Zn2+ uptake regulation protein
MELLKDESNNYYCLWRENYLDCGSDKVMKKSQERNQDYLRERLDARGSHLTRQRVAVYDYLNEVAHHPTAEEVFLAVKRQLPKISLATVYKNLEALVDCGAISKLTYGDAAARYDMRTDHHYHTRCLECGKVTDLDSATGDDVLKSIKPQAGFKVQNYRLELLGYCRGCR